MAFLYHFVPPDMRGDILYPLNKLKEVYPDIYESASAKYKGRAHVMEQKIPQWNCLWNDVLFLSVLDPAIIKKELQKLGLPFQKEISYYEIDPKTLDKEKTMVYLYPSTKKKKDPAVAEDFVPYDPNDLEKYAVLPEATIEYFKEAIKENRRPLLYVYIPHVVYNGTLDTRGLTVRTL